MQETITFNLEVIADDATENVRRLETLIFRTLGLLRRLGLPENIDAAILKIQQLVMTIRILHSAFIALQAATGPIGWLLGAVVLISGILSAGEFMMELT